MDSSVSRIADYASKLRFSDLPAAVVHDCKRRIIDTLGCGLGAFDAEPSRIARKIALRTEHGYGSERIRHGPSHAARACGFCKRRYRWSFQ